MIVIVCLQSLSKYEHSREKKYNYKINDSFVISLPTEEKKIKINMNPQKKKKLSLQLQWDAHKDIPYKISLR